MTDDNYENLVKTVERLIEDIVNQEELKKAVEFLHRPFVLFNYPGGVSYELRQGGELHFIKESCDRGTTSLSAVARRYVDKLVLYDIGEIVEAEIGSSAKEFTGEYTARLDSGRLPERLRPLMRGSSK